MDTVSFNSDPGKFSRKQDSIITDIVATLNKTALNVGKVDKKLNIISVEVTYGDELFAREFANNV